MRVTIAALFLLLLSVLPADAQDSSIGGQDDFVGAVVDHATPFVGQQIVYSFRYYTSVNVQNAPNYSPPDFEGFWQAETYTIPPYTQQVGERQYAVSEVRTVLYPVREGTLVIAPGKLTFPETLGAAQRVLTTEVVEVQVQPLPEGAPSDFSGAVGQFDMLATIDRQTASLGELIILRVIVTGSGNVEQLPVPTLTVSADWRIYDSPGSYHTIEQGALLIGEKTFEWLLLPDQPGVHTLAPVTLTYFDPQSLAYRSISTASVSLEIRPPEEDSGLAATAQSPSVAQRDILPLKPVPASLQTATPDVGLFFWLLWLVPPGTAFIACWWVYRQAQQRRNQVAIRQSRALRKAQDCLRVAQAASAQEAYHRIEEAVMGYFADRLNCKRAEIQPVDLQSNLNGQRISQRAIEQIGAILELAQQMRYAPVDVLDAGPLVTRASQVLSSVDATWGDS